MFRQPFADTPTRPPDTELNARNKILDEVGRGLVSTAFELLVSVSAMIGSDDLRRLGRAAWEDALLSTDDVIVSRVCPILPLSQYHAELLI